MKEGEESPAVKQLHRALEVNPDDGVLLSILALKLLKEKPQEAERLVERALKIGPDNPHVTRYVAKYLRIKVSLNDSQYLRCSRVNKEVMD